MPLLKKVVSRLRSRLTGEAPVFLDEITGLIHIGANTGQESESYARHHLRVEWIEPDPAVFAQLESHIAPHTRQRAHNLLISDTDGTEVDFHISNNNGASSSMLDLAAHRDIWPEVDFEKTIRLRTTTLERFAQDAGLNMSHYQALVIDTQGAELRVLHGARNLLDHFTFIHAELPDFEAYRGCAQFAEVESFLLSCGFKLFSHLPFANAPGGGTYYESLFKRHNRP